MIITRIIGGMGNQMFQYAVGRRLAMKHNTVLKLDIRDFQTYSLHEYALDAFAIQASIASEEELHPFRRASSPSALSTLSGKIIQKITKQMTRLPNNYISEPHFNFAPEILDLPDNVYLDGYWQSTKYFADVSQQIAQDFVIKQSPVGKNKELLAELQSTEEDSVALHIRRSDYLTNKASNKQHGVAPLSYYEQAVTYLASHGVKQPHFYIFSDDHVWARENLRLIYPSTFVIHNDRDHGYEDLRLMSHCKDFIIANSTFSWWGAWLAQHPGKLVIAPQQWFRENTKDTSDLIPSSWIRL